MSSISLPSSSLAATPRALVTTVHSPTTTQTATSSSTDPDATSTDIFDIPTDDPIGGSKHIQPYIYITVALAVVLLISVQLCRLMERKRLRQRQAMRRGNAEDDEDAAFAKLHPPVMYSVYLDQKHEGGEWEDGLPLSSNVVIRPEKLDPSGMGDEPASSSLRAVRTAKAVLDAIGQGVLVALDVLGLYDKFAADQRRLEAVRKPQGEDEERAAIDTRLPRDLVTSITIAMPTLKSSRARQKQEMEMEIYEEEQLPDVVVGILETRWHGSVSYENARIKI